MVEQPLLTRKTTTVSGERAIGANDAMARHDDRDWIRSVGDAHRATRRGAADVRCNLTVTFRRARFDRAKRSPYGTLERRAACRRADAIQRRQIAVKIGVE